jgi:hypothetical protein
MAKGDNIIEDKTKTLAIPILVDISGPSCRASVV